MSLIERLFSKTTEQLVLVPGTMELTLLHRSKIAMLFVAGEILDDSPYVELAKQFEKKGYSLHLFQLPEPKA